MKKLAAMMKKAAAWLCGIGGAVVVATLVITMMKPEAIESVWVFYPFGLGVFASALGAFVYALDIADEAGRRGLPAPPKHGRGLATRDVRWNEPAAHSGRTHRRGKNAA